MERMGTWRCCKTAKKVMRLTLAVLIFLGRGLSLQGKIECLMLDWVLTDGSVLAHFREGRAVRYWQMEKG